MSLRRALSGDSSSVSAAASVVDPASLDPESLILLVAPTNKSTSTRSQYLRQGQGPIIRLLQATSVAVYLATWVANAEMLQGVSNGMFTGGVPYDRPAAITWYSYNYMLLSIVAVYPYVRWRRKTTVQHYIQTVWAGRLGLRKSICICALISYALQCLNIFYIMGLQCITVSMSNASFQLQAAFTIGLSSCLLRDKVVAAEKLGIAISTAGVALVVLPPLFHDEGMASIHQCSSQSSPVLFGILVTIVAAAIGGAYLVSWRLLDERRHFDEEVPKPKGKAKGGGDRLEGLVETLITLFMIGACNLVFGWPVLLCLHWLGFESIQIPPTPLHWKMLHWNGIVEYGFDTSCAVAIYMTSPVVTAIVAPLTIPLSLVADSWVYGAITQPSNASSQIWMRMGSGVILLGVFLVESKPDMTSYVFWRKRHDGNTDGFNYEVPTKLHKTVRIL